MPSCRQVTTLKPCRVSARNASSGLPGRCPGEQVDHVLRAPVHHRRRRMAIDIIQPAPDQREPLILQIAHRRRDIQPRRQPRLHRVLIAGQHVRQMLGLHRTDVAADHRHRRIILPAHHQHGQRHAGQCARQPRAGQAERRHAEPRPRAARRAGASSRGSAAPMRAASPGGAR